MIIAIGNQKGGVAKTTSTIALAHELSQYGPTLAIDFDPQGNMTTGFGIAVEDEQPTIYDVLLHNHPAAETIVASAGVDVIPSNILLAKGERELIVTFGATNYLQAKITPLREQYKFILIDCPPSLGALTYSALTAADSVLIPVQCQYYALIGLKDFLETIQAVQQGTNPKLSIVGILPTMAEKTVVTNEVLQNLVALSESEKYTVFDPVPKSIKFTEASVQGLPIQCYVNDARLAAPYRAIAAHLANVPAETAA